MPYDPYNAYTANPYQTDPYALIQQAMQYQPPAQPPAAPAQLTPSYNTTEMNPFTAALMQRLSQNNNIQGLLNADSANPNLAQSPGLLSQGFPMPQGHALAMPIKGGPADMTNPWDYYRLNGDFWKKIYTPATTATSEGLAGTNDRSGGGSEGGGGSL